MKSIYIKSYSDYIVTYGLIGHEYNFTIQPNDENLHPTMILDSSCDVHFDMLDYPPPIVSRLVSIITWQKV